MTEPLGVSVEEAKRQLGDVSTATIYRLMSRGQLEKRKVGNRTVITMASIKALLGAPALSEVA
jgi:hypothetical protein